jgi:cytochrome c-type biogenesis protein CcmE
VLSDPNAHTGRANVVYHGSVPDLYKVGRVVVIDGTLRNGTFVGHDLSTKCPSKYSPAKKST